MNGTVVLPEIADPGATETPVAAWFSDGSGNKMGKMDFDVGFDAGAGAFEAAESLHLIADKLVIWRILKRQKVLEESVNFFWPCLVMVAAACTGLKGFTLFQPGTSKLIEAGCTNSKLTGGARCIQKSSIEICKNPKDEIGR